MNLSQEIRNILTKSGDWMSVAEITDALGGLADKNFVGSICSQHAKARVFRRTTENGRLVYKMDDVSAPALADPPMAEESPSVRQQPVAAVPCDAAPAVTNGQPERVATPSVATAAPAVPDHIRVNAPEASSTTAKLNAMVSEMQDERIQRMERTSHNLARLLASLLGDAIDAKLEHDLLRRLSTAQLAVQDVHGFLANGA